MAWNYLNYDITHIVLAALYLVLGGVAVYAWWNRPTSNVSPIQKVFYPLMLFGVLVRALFMMLQPFIRENDIRLPNQANVLLNSLPSFIFFSNYLIVLFIWAEMYLIFDGSSMKVVHRLPWIFNLMAVSMYTTITILYILDFTIYPLSYQPISAFNDTIEYIIGTFDGCCFIFLALAYSVVGTSLIVKFREPHPNFTEDKRRIVVKRVTVVTLLVFICFLIRAAITLFAVNKDNLISGTWWWFDGVYFFSFEIVPITIMLYALRMNNGNSSHYTYAHSTNIKRQDMLNIRSASGSHNDYAPLLGHHP
ncbi:hypothetical protein SAMD00019534_112150 [Acytostelium subglobosum LB1]|uniref:hypothetical protein n=1 Tax=Acytostelium subglobosum LB1 TaxID=1410327 RepID=UPI000644C3E3|nr:hypothetical protein SAMD00019534_112150 [Acytostelium subglobosum LB1]GAM28039.1 hypothetical protein SAMD00019534_112150 [Acytostelium subglobosum LB1]|eukprot:XP_012748998.1 hypothetical protein SAMD00019534_112150 [Acytostelium subglobosum LB1]